MNHCINDLILHLGWGRSGRDRMVAGLATTYAISAYHHYSCELKSRLLDITLCDKLCY